MTDGEMRCPKCGSTDLVSIQNKAIDAELVECQSCKQLYQVMYEPDGTTPRLVTV
jgi:transcription elongation factor Elf1